MFWIELTIGKFNSFHLFTLWHSKITDYFFTYFTHLGDGLFALFLIVILLIAKKKELSLLIFFSYSSSGLLAQFIKHLVHTQRPGFFKEITKNCHFVQGVKINLMNSFPSGHTTSAFAIATILIFYFPTSKWKAAILLTAFLVGYSRIYLVQHFVSDVGCGMLLGTLCGVFVVEIYKFLNQKNNNAFTLELV